MSSEVNFMKASIRMIKCQTKGNKILNEINKKMILCQRHS